MGIKVTTSKQPQSRVTINTHRTRSIKTIGIGTPSSLAGLSDVDASDADNDEVPVWDESIQQFVVKKIPKINGGEF